MASKRATKISLHNYAEWRLFNKRIDPPPTPNQIQTIQFKHYKKSPKFIRYFEDDTNKKD